MASFRSTRFLPSEKNKLFDDMKYFDAPVAKDMKDGAKSMQVFGASTSPPDEANPSSARLFDLLYFNRAGLPHRFPVVLVYCMVCQEWTYHGSLFYECPLSKKAADRDVQYYYAMLDRTPGSASCSSSSESSSSASDIACGDDCSRNNDDENQQVAPIIPRPPTSRRFVVGNPGIRDGRHKPLPHHRRFYNLPKFKTWLSEQGFDPSSLLDE